MLKRKYGNRPDWKRIKEKKYSQLYLETAEFQGYITLLHTIKVTEPLFVKYGEKNVCIVDDGYMWLQQFPLGKNHLVTTTFDEKGNVIQWYIDICSRTGVENGIPWMEDLFLDIVVLPSGEIIELDLDEFEDAFSKGIINQSLYDLAWKEMKLLRNLIRNGRFDLLKLSNIHKEMLVKSLL